jgi:hypothetical protein
MSENEFSVWWWDMDDGQHEEVRFVSAPEAGRAFCRLTTGPAARLGIVRRVIITDGGDCICAESRDGQLTYPPLPPRPEPPRPEGDKHDGPLEQNVKLLVVAEAARDLIENIRERGSHDNWKACAEALRLLNGGEKHDGH